ncbi:MAG: SPOR domain-containing protein [Saprospiraceae bacterium]
MNTNKMLSYLLYALLVGLVAVAGYKVWQMKKDKEKMAMESAEFEQGSRDLVFQENDTTDSAYDDSDSLYSSSSIVVSDEGIEGDIPVSQPASEPQQKTNGKPKKAEPTASAPKPAAPAAQAEQPRNMDTDAGDGRYRVVAGSFTKLDGARREMERIIKMGYQDAEVGLYNRGRFAVVIVKRTDNLNEAVRIAEALEKKGFEASVIDRERKK